MKLTENMGNIGGGIYQRRDACYLFYRVSRKILPKE